MWLKGGRRTSLIPATVTGWSAADCCQKHRGAVTINHSQEWSHYHLPQLKQNVVFLLSCPWVRKKQHTPASTWRRREAACVSWVLGMLGDVCMRQKRQGWPSVTSEGRAGAKEPFPPLGTRLRWLSALPLANRSHSNQTDYWETRHHFLLLWRTPTPRWVGQREQWRGGFGTQPTGGKNPPGVMTPAPGRRNALGREKLSRVIMVVRMEQGTNRESLNWIFDNTEILWASIEFLLFFLKRALFKQKACKGFQQTPCIS